MGEVKEIGWQRRGDTALVRCYKVKKSRVVCKGEQRLPAFQDLLASSAPFASAGADLIETSFLFFFSVSSEVSHTSVFIGNCFHFTDEDVQRAQ